MKKASQYFVLSVCMSLFMGPPVEAARSRLHPAYQEEEARVDSKEQRPADFLGSSPVIDQVADEAGDRLRELEEQLKGHVLRGKKGEKGDPGERGLPGPPGDRGLRGYNGEMGKIGPQGLIGPTGPQGERGVQGPTGPCGEKGDPGAKGEMGPIGVQGPQGALGPAGEAGVPGKKGDKGDTGERGERGDVGPVGPQGEKGERGDPGPVGPTGEVGPQGEPGPAGLPGERGDTGPAGPAGPRGEQGPPGEGVQGGGTGYHDFLSVFSRMRALVDGKVNFTDVIINVGAAISFFPGSDIIYINGVGVYLINYGVRFEGGKESVHYCLKFNSVEVLGSRMKQKSQSKFGLSEAAMYSGSVIFHVDTPGFLTLECTKDLSQDSLEDMTAYLNIVRIN